MAVHIFPDPHTAPQTVPAGGFTTPVSTINSATPGETGPDNDSSELGITATSIPETLFVRVSMQGPVPPTVYVQINTGTEREINTTYPSMTSISNGVDPTDAADGTCYPPDANSTYLTKIFIFIDGTVKIRIKNNDAAAHDCVWVIGSSQAITRQPWIDILPLALPPGASTNFDALTGQTPPPLATLQVANKGTGPLSITDPVGTTVGGTNFNISADPLDNPQDPMNPGHVPAISPNSILDLKIGFTAPVAVGVTSTTYLLNTSDSLALTTSGHNRQIGLSGTARKLEVMMMLDASGSMAFMPDGSSTVTTLNDSRWGRLKISAKQFLDLMGTLGDGKGKFGVGMFPDITAAGCPVPSPSAFDIFAPGSVGADITAMNIGSAKANLDLHTPVQNCAGTPIGFGIGRAISTIAGAYGYFMGTPDALAYNKRYLVLMSDGASNSTPPAPTDFYGSGATSFKGKKVKVITVAYGDETGTPFEVDHTLMTAISAASADTLSEASTLTLDAGASDLLDLHKAFRTAISTGFSLIPIADPRGTLTHAAPEARRQVTITPYDTRAIFAVGWGTASRNRVNMTLITPNCEVITPASALTDPNIFYGSDLTYAVYSFNYNFLKNTAPGGHSRYGTWTILLTGPDLKGASDSESYDYEVLTDSRIKMNVTAEKSTYYAGDIIKVNAFPELDGKGITAASVSLQVTAPGQSASNWLAQNKVTPTEYAQAAKMADRTDPSRIGVKAMALKTKGMVFDDSTRSSTLAMLDPTGKGMYSAQVTGTSVPGSYDLYVVATGTTKDGVAFRREKRLNLYLDVRPDPKFTLIDTIYRWVENRLLTEVRVIPRDRFGNLVLIDPQTDPRIVLTVRGGKFTSPLVDNLDGSYTRVLQAKPGVRLMVGLEFVGEKVIPARRVPLSGGLTFLNRVAEFKPGLEAIKGANRHADPKAALGDILIRKQPGVFTSLGGEGVLVLEAEGQIIKARGEGDDVTVFVHADESLRPYRVDALPVTGRKWVTLGHSEGVTQSFSLEDAHVSQARAIRITDLSGKTRDANVKPLATPGVSILGVGVKKTNPRKIVKRT